MNLCRPSVKEDIRKAKQDREDYLNDYNFLQYLKSPWARITSKTRESGIADEN